MLTIVRGSSSSLVLTTTVLADRLYHAYIVFGWLSTVMLVAVLCFYILNPKLRTFYGALIMVMCVVRLLLFLCKVFCWLTCFHYGKCTITLDYLSADFLSLEGAVVPCRGPSAWLIRQET